MTVHQPFEALPLDSVDRYALPDHRGKLYTPRGGRPLLRAKEVAAMFGVTERRVRRAMWAGALPALDLGGGVRRIPSDRIPVELAKAWREGARLKHEWPTGPLVYFVAGIPGYVKIGFSTNLAKRLENLRCSSPVPLTVLAAIRGSVAMERDLHARFAADRAHGEWFKRSKAIDALLAELMA